MIRFSKEEAYAKGRDLVRLIESDYRGRAPRAEKIRSVRDQYYGTINRVLRYPGQPNAHLPVVTEKIEAMVPKEMNALWASDPHVNVRRVGREFNERDTLENEQFLNWAIETDIPNFYEVTENMTRSKYLDGTSVVKIWYNEETRKTVQREYVRYAWAPGEVDLAGQIVPAARMKIPIEIISQALGVDRLQILEGNEDEAESVEDLHGRSFVVDFVDTDLRTYQGVVVEFDPSQFADRIDIIIHRRVMWRDNVEVDNIEFDDLIAPYRTRNLQEAPRVAQKYGLTIAEVEQRIAKDDWDLDDDELGILTGRSRNQHQEEHLHEQQQSLEIQEDQAVGEYADQRDNSPIWAPFANDKILMLEVYAREDVDGDGEWEEVIYQIPYGLRKIVKAYYLEELYPHGRRPFAEFHCIPISNNWYSMSIGEYLLPINVEVDSSVNLVQEAQEIINFPYFGYVPTSLAMDPEKALNLVPGEGIPLIDRDGLVFPSMQQQPLANLQLVDSLLLFADRLSAPPQSVGSSQVRNAPRTARGTLALLSEAGIKVDAYIMASQKGGWRELINQIHALYAHYGTDEKRYWVTGNPNPRKISRAAMKGRFEYTFSGNSVNTNREVKRTIAQVRYTTLAAEPLYQMDLNARLELVRDFLRHFSEGVDVEKLMPKLPGAGGTHPPYDQDTENQMMMQLIPVDVLPTDDHAVHLKKIQQLQQSSVFESLRPEGVALVANHYMQHANIMAAMQQQAAMTPQGATQSNNVPIGPELGDLEGGVV